MKITERKAANDWRSGHRARLRAKFLEHKCTARELLELLLTYAIPRTDVKPLVSELMAAYGNIHKVITAPIEDLCAFRGLKENTAIFLKAVYEIMLLDYKNYLADTPLFYNSKKLEDYCRLILMDKRQEEFHVLYLDVNRRLLVDDLHSIGTTDNVAVYPREILRRALGTNTEFVVLIHNHPDGSRSFSQADIERWKSKGC